MSEDVLVNETGACRYCGQAGMVRVPDGASDEEITEAVTMGCTCDEARMYQKRKKRIGKVMSYAEERFGAGSKGYYAFIAAAEAVIKGDIDQITLKAGAYSFTVMLNNEGYLAVSQKRTDTDKVKF